jgi:hypothetical protein
MALTTDKRAWSGACAACLRAEAAQRRDVLSLILRSRLGRRVYDGMPAGEDNREHFLRGGNGR